MEFPSSSPGVLTPAGFASSFPAAPRHSSLSCPPLAPQTRTDPQRSWDDPVHDKTPLLLLVPTSYQKHLHVREHFMNCPEFGCVYLRFPDSSVTSCMTNIIIWSFYMILNLWMSILHIFYGGSKCFIDTVTGFFTWPMSQLTIASHDSKCKPPGTFTL